MLASILAACSFGLNSFALSPALAQDRSAEAADLKELYLSLPGTPADDYYRYAARHSGQKYSGERLVFPLTEMSDQEETEGGGFLLEYGETIELTVDVPESAFYQAGLRYRSTDNNILPNALSLKLNGQHPYPETMRLVANNVWISPVEEVPQDRYGNEVMPMPSKSMDWNFTWFHGEEYVFSEPMGLYLEAGENVISLTSTEGDLVIGEIELAPVAEALAPAGEKRAEGDALIRIQAEALHRRNSPNIRPDSTYNTNVTPYSSTKKVLNYVSDISFRAGGDRIEYDFTADSAGWYYVALRYRQAEKANFPVFRNIYIDGEIPAAEFSNFAVPYSTGFSEHIVSSAAGEAAAIYLEAGPHTITLEVSLDPVRDAIKIITLVAGEMSEMALDIGKVTGGNTDRFRDFRLEDFDFDIEGKLHEWADILQTVYNSLAAYNPDVSSIGALSSLQVAAKTMRTLAQEPNDLPKNMDAFTTGPSSARQNLTTMLEQLYQGPLGLDEIVIFQESSSRPDNMGLLERMLSTVKRFFYSFTSQEYTPAFTANTENLQIWVNRPRQYLEIMQRMSDTAFTQKTGINVDLSLMPDQNRLILANASGSSPDAALSIAAGLTYDLAVRDVLANMREFDSFKDVAGRVPPGLLIPGVSGEGVYAMPETFNFWVMYYRTDLMESMNISVPDTMEEVRAILPQLQRRGMNFNSHVSNFVGIKPFAATIPFLYQNGGSLFGDGILDLNLDSEAALEGMSMLTENYTIYNMPYEVQSFYQSFRDGTIPIGIADYGMLNLLTNAAPEIAGLWDVAPYPGVEDETGEVRRWTLGSAESIIILEDSDKKEEAWDFVDWWTSTEVQTEFGYTLQSTLGNEYLWNPANLEAMANTPWIQKHEELIEQVKWTREPPRVLGGYMIERELSNVVTSVVMEGGNLRSSLDEAIKRIEREIARKLEEFGYLKDGGLTEEFIVPDIETVEGWLN